MYSILKQFIGKPPINPLIFYSGKLSCFLLMGWFLIAWFSTRGGLVSIVLIGLGILILAISWMHLGRSTRIGIPEEATDLKKGGIYRISRNPMYIALYLMNFGWILYLMDIMALLFGLYCIAVHHCIVLSEERFLLERFKNAYLDYQKNVRRYL